MPSWVQPLDDAGSRITVPYLRPPSESWQVNADQPWITGRRYQVAAVGEHITNEWSFETVWPAAERPVADDFVAMLKAAAESADARLLVNIAAPHGSTAGDIQFVAETGRVEQQYSAGQSTVTATMLRVVAPTIPTPDVDNQTTAGVSGSSSLTIDVPAVAAADDFLLLVVGNDDTTATQQWADDLSGWTLVLSAGDGTSDAHIGVYWTVASSALILAGSVTVPCASVDGALDYWGFMVPVADVDAGDPVNVVGTADTSGNQQSFDIAEVTTTAVGCLAVYVLGFDGGDGAPFSVSGVRWVEGGEVTAGTGGANASGTWGHKPMLAADATGTATVTASVDDNAVRVQFALNGTGVS